MIIPIVYNVNKNNYARTDYLETKYYFEPNHKTPTLEIISKNSNTVIGYIKWFSNWRKFCLFPVQDTIWDNKCLTEIEALIDIFTKSYKQYKEVNTNELNEN